MKTQKKSDEKQSNYDVILGGTNWLKFSPISTKIHKFCVFCFITFFDLDLLK